MGISKTNLFTAEQNELADLAKVLSHPARIAILQHLIQSKVCINATLVEELGLAQATVSQHLKELKNCGIIQGTIEGVAMSYCINPAAWLEIKSKIMGLFDEHDCCKSDGCC